MDATTEQAKPYPQRLLHSNANFRTGIAILEMESENYQPRQKFSKEKVQSGGCCAERPARSAWGLAARFQTIRFP